MGFRKCTVGTPAQRFSSLAVLRQGIAAAAQELAGPGEEELAKRAAAAATALRHDSAWCCRNCANAAKASLPGLFAALKAQEAKDAKERGGEDAKEPEGGAASAGQAAEGAMAAVWRRRREAWRPDAKLGLLAVILQLSPSGAAEPEERPEHPLLRFLTPRDICRMGCCRAGMALWTACKAHALRQRNLMDADAFTVKVHLVERRKAYRKENQESSRQSRLAASRLEELRVARDKLKTLEDDLEVGTARTVSKRSDIFVKIAMF